MVVVLAVVFVSAKAVTVLIEDARQSAVPKINSFFLII